MEQTSSSYLEDEKATSLGLVNQTDYRGQGYFILANFSVSTTRLLQGQS